MNRSSWILVVKSSSSSSSDMNQKFCMNAGEKELHEWLTSKDGLNDLKLYNSFGWLAGMAFVKVLNKWFE